MKLLLGVGLMAIGTLIFTLYLNFGTKPSEKDKKRFNTSKNFDKESSRFRNRQQKKMQAAEKKMDGWAILKKMMKNSNNEVPKKKLPEVTPNLKAFLEEDHRLKTIWLGHSTLLLNMNGKIILVDPVFSGYASPINFLVKRFQDPVLQLVDLPKIDYILISHDHYDHLDRKSIKHFKNSDTIFITPLGVGSHLIGWGIPKERITEKDWWELEDRGDIKFIATPAQHFSGRSLTDRNHTLWASWVIQTKDHNIYFSGDSGYDTHFKDIGDRYGPFDVAFIESGQYNKAWTQVHLMPSRFVQTFKDLKAKKYFPIHWGMFRLSIHAWYEPIVKLNELSKLENFVLIAPKIGQLVDLKNPDPVEIWWQD